ncbi:MAG: asparagine synthase (glutamine-hydrolyzing), partial [Planctomycetes bacterium]|nr:asparagine synthase (glutamine-hydrolyzing) [Planctomycetota bacterium]
MCGIAGYIGFDDEPLLRAMCRSITHRGPDEDGFHTEPGIGLCVRRLSIIDLVTGHQPISNETSDIWVVFNGEIYNYTELTEELKRRGHIFRTTTDTETIVHLYEEHGLDFVQHLRGMFGIAIWDSCKKRLVLARDRIGEKPLYYSWDDKCLLFGSEAKAILQHTAERQVDATAVCQFLACGYVPSPTSFYRHIRKLPPGHLLVHENGHVETRSYWRLETQRSALTFDAAAERLEDELTNIVQGCLKSDVEVGVLLSGGLDSSLIVALMAEHGVRPHSFTVGYDAGATGFNELKYAARVARMFSREHHEITISGRASIELLPRVLWHFDEPHGEPTSILVYLLCQFTRQHLKVALGGTGGDELFFGYPRHSGIRYLQYYRLLPRGVRRHLVERVVMRWPESTAGSRFAKRARRFVSGSDLPPDEAYLSWVSLLHRDVRSRLVSESISSMTEDPLGEAPLREYLMAGSDQSLYERAAALDVNNYLPEFQLSYIDRM